MRHQHAFKKFSRTTSHRRAMFRNLVTSLVLHERIETTFQKAKQLKRIADKLVTLGKTDNLHNRRRAMAYLMPINREVDGDKEKWTSVHKLFTQIGPQFSERKGGYTRVLKTRVRPGDSTQMAMIAFVEGKEFSSLNESNSETSSEKNKVKKTRRTSRTKEEATI